MEDGVFNVTSSGVACCIKIYILCCYEDIYVTYKSIVGSDTFFMVQLLPFEHSNVKNSFVRLTKSYIEIFIN